MRFFVVVATVDSMSKLNMNIIYYTNLLKIYNKGNILPFKKCVRVQSAENEVVKIKTLLYSNATKLRNNKHIENFQNLSDICMFVLFLSEILNPYLK